MDFKTDNTLGAAANCLFFKVWRTATVPLTTNPLPGLAIAIAVSCARHNLATASRFNPRTNVNPSRPRLASFIASARIATSRSACVPLMSPSSAQAATSRTLYPATKRRLGSFAATEMTDNVSRE